MRLIIEIEATQRPERPRNGKELTVMSISMRLDDSNTGLEPETIAKARHNSRLLLEIAERINQVVTPTICPYIPPLSEPRTDPQTDGRSPQA